MRHDRSPVWIGIADLLLCVVGVAVVAAALTKAKIEASTKGGISYYRRLVCRPRFER